MRTYNGFQWELGKCVEVLGEGKLCSPGWFHFYNDPLVGMFMNPAHANIENPRLFRAEVEGNFIDDNGLKCGYAKARLVEELAVPQISLAQRVRFAIFCVKEVYKEKKWNKWADNWLSGKDRTEESAAIIAYTIESVASTVKSAESAFYAAKSAASTFYTVKIITIAFYAAKSAESAADSAVRSATKNKKIDLIGIAQKAMKE